MLPDCGRVSVTLVTGATGLVGSHVTRLLVQRGDRVRATVRTGSILEQIEDLGVEMARCDILDRQAVRRAMRDVTRVFHIAGLTSLRAGADALYRVNVDGTRIVLEEALRAGVERVVHTSSVAAIGPAPRGATADERQVFRAGHHGLPYVNSKHAAENEALRVAAHGLPVVTVNPSYVLGRGDVYRSSTVLVRRFLCRQIPAYVDGALNVVDAHDVAIGHLLADELGVPGERYILGNRNFTLDRLFADLSRLSGVEPPAVKLPLPVALQLATAAERLPGQAADHGRRGQGRLALVGVPLDQGQARSRLEALAPRGHARRHDRLVPRARARDRRPAGRSPAAGAARRRLRRAPRRRSRLGVRPMSATLYRCRTPTDRLCACGRVARELRSHGIEYEEVRVAVAPARPRRGRRASGQRVVPLLVIDGEAICDSRRIVENLRARAGEAAAGADQAAARRADLTTAASRFGQTPTIPTASPMRGSVRATADRPLGLGVASATRVPRRPSRRTDSGTGSVIASPGGSTPTWDT